MLIIMKKTLFCCTILFPILFIQINCKHSLEKCIRNCLPDDDDNFDQNLVWRPDPPFRESEIFLSSRSDIDNCEDDICESVDHYPTELIEKAVNQNKDIKGYFGSVTEIHVPPKIGNRNGVDYSENLCKTRARTRHPKIAKNREGKLIYVVNTKNYAQSLTYEACSGQDMECAHRYCFPTGYKSICKQNYMTVKLISLVENGTLVYETFPVPSNCVCTNVRIYS